MSSPVISEIPLNYSYRVTTMTQDEWKDEMVDLLTRYLSGEVIHVGFKDAKRTGSVGRLVISNVQELLGGPQTYGYYGMRSPAPPKVEEKPENVHRKFFDFGRHPTGKVVWDGRKNRVDVYGGEVHWIKDHKGGTVWSYGKPVRPVPVVHDKLGQELQVGDFISYILYHFDNKNSQGYRTAAGIYYGRVTKIDGEGAVWAKNIKLKEDDRVADKKINDPSLIVIMSKDLMNKLMMARLSIA